MFCLTDADRVEVDKREGRREKSGHDKEVNSALS